MRKLHRILLVDDDHTTNLLHQLLLEEMDVAEGIDIALNGKEALDHINSCDIKDLPDLILLDLNMPLMNGLEFLEHYENVVKERKGSVKLLMLSTTTNPEDIAKAKQYDAFSEFVNKPLTEKKISKIWSQYFSN